MPNTIIHKKQFAVAICQNTLEDRIKNIMETNRRYCQVIDRYNNFDMVSESSLLFASHYFTLIKNGLRSIDSFEDYAMFKETDISFLAFRQDYSKKAPDYGGNDGRREFLKKEFATRIKEILAMVSKNNMVCKRWKLLDLRNNEVLTVVFDVLSSCSLPKLENFEKNVLLGWNWPEPSATTKYVFEEEKLCEDEQIAAKVASHVDPGYDSGASSIEMMEMELMSKRVDIPSSSAPHSHDSESASSDGSIASDNVADLFEAFKKKFLPKSHEEVAEIAQRYFNRRIIEIFKMKKGSVTDQLLEKYVILATSDRTKDEYVLACFLASHRKHPDFVKLEKYYFDM